MDFILKRRFSVVKGKRIFFCTWCSCSPPSVSQLSLPPSSSSQPPFFLLFYLRSLSEGLTISSSVSLLSCSAVYCLWFAQAHPCGCLFQRPSVTRWIEEDPAEPSHGCTPLLAALGHTGSPHLCTHTDARAHYPTCQVVEAMGCGTRTCLAAGISWVFV